MYEGGLINVTDIGAPTYEACLDFCVNKGQDRCGWFYFYRLTYLCVYGVPTGSYEGFRDAPYHDTGLISSFIPKLKESL